MSLHASSVHTSWLAAHEGTIGIIVGLAAIIVAVLIAIAQRRPKTLAWDVVFDEPLTNPRHAVPKLAFTWDGRDIKKPRLLRIRLENTGRQAIVKNDYWNPPKVTVKDGQLLSAKISSHSGKVYEELPDLDEPEGESVWTFDAPAFNPGEWVQIQFVIDGGDTPAIEARIAGETKAFHRQTLPASQRRLTYFTFIWGFIGIGLSVILAWQGNVHNDSIYYISAGIVAYLAVGIMGFPFMGKIISRVSTRWDTRT